MPPQRYNPADKETFAADPHTIRMLLQDGDWHKTELLVECNQDHVIDALSQVHPCVLPLDQLGRSTLSAMLYDKGMFRKSRFVILARGLGINDPMALTQREFINELTGKAHDAFMTLSNLIVRRELPASFYNGRECLKEMILALQATPSLAVSDAEHLLLSKIEPYDFGPAQWHAILTKLCSAKLMIYRPTGFIYVRLSCYDMLAESLYRHKRLVESVDELYGDEGSTNMRLLCGKYIQRFAHQMEEAQSYDGYLTLERQWQLKLASRASYPIYNSTMHITQTAWRTFAFLYQTHAREELASCFDKPFDVSADLWWQQQAEVNTALITELAMRLMNEKQGPQKSAVLDILSIMSNITTANIQAVDNALERYRRPSRVAEKIDYPNVTNFFSEILNTATPYVDASVLQAFEF